MLVDLVCTGVKNYRRLPVKGYPFLWWEFTPLHGNALSVFLNPPISLSIIKERSKRIAILIISFELSCLNIFHINVPHQAGTLGC